MKRILAAAALAVLSATTTARAEEQTPEALFAAAKSALDEGRAGDAIGRLEAMGDRGVVDAAASFDRGLAYALRARSPSAQPGDLGRAVHGFEEARELTRDGRLEDEATRALVALRSEIARRRARAGESAELAIGATFGKAVVGLASENTWAGLAATASAVLALAVLLRARATAARARVAANTTLGISGAVLVATALLASGARTQREHVREGVIVAPGTRLLDARRVVLAGRDPIAEGARLELLEEDAGFRHIRAGSLEGWVTASAVLPIAKR